MTLAAQIALTATPLSAYFYALGVWHGGRGPRLVSGPVDAALLTAGLGGLVAFGPVGQIVIARLAGSRAGPIPWALWVALLATWAVVFALSAARRLAVYNVTEADLDRAVREALGQLDGRFVATVQGFEDPERGTGLAVRCSRRLRAGSVEAHGSDPEAFLAELKPRLRVALGRITTHPSATSTALFGTACAVMLVPVAGFFLANPRAKDALRALLHSLRWW